MFRRFCLAFGLIVLCVNDSSAKAPLPPSPLAQDLPVELVLNQQELAVDVPDNSNSFGASLGVIGAVVAAGINNEHVKTAEARVVPIRDLVIDYPFNDRLEAALRAKLKADGISPNPMLRVVTTPWDAKEVASPQDLPLHALMITPHYAIDNKFDHLSVRLTALIVDRQIKPSGKIKTDVTFYRIYQFQFPLEAIAGGDNALRWAAMGKARLAELLDQAIAQTTDMLVYDFSTQGRSEWRVSTRSSLTLKGKTYDGMLLRQTPDWLWARVGKDWGKYVNLYGDLVPEGWTQHIEGYQPISDQVVASAVESVAPATTPAAIPVSSAATGN